LNLASPGTYRFIAAKRFEKIGWKDREYWFAHSVFKIRLEAPNFTLDGIGLQVWPEPRSTKRSLDLGVHFAQHSAIPPK
jgi:hypothetical protein